MKVFHIVIGYKVGYFDILNPIGKSHIFFFIYVLFLNIEHTYGARKGEKLLLIGHTVSEGASI